MTAFYDPPAGFLASLARRRRGGHATGSNVRRETELWQDGPYLLVVVAFIQAQPLRLVVGRYGALDQEALKGGSHQFHIVTVRPLNSQPDRHSLPLSQETPFDSAFAPVGRVGACLFPPQGGLCSSRHPYSTTPNRCPAIRQSVRRRLARASETRPPPPIRKSDHGRWIWRTMRSASTPPTGSPCVAHRKWHRHTDEPKSAGARRPNGACSRAPATRVPAPSTTRRRGESPWSSGCSEYGCDCAYLRIVCSCPTVYPLFG